MHRRKPDSIARTWALVVTAAILYIPANVLPVMTVIYFGRGEPDTILSGVKQLIGAGMCPVALLVFFASITVPVLKLIGLTFLLITVQRRSRWRLRDRGPAELRRCPARSRRGGDARRGLCPYDAGGGGLLPVGRIGAGGADPVRAGDRRAGTRG